MQADRIGEALVDRAELMDMRDAPELENPCEVCEEHEADCPTKNGLCQSCDETQSDRAFERMRDALVAPEGTP